MYRCEIASIFVHIYYNLGEGGGGGFCAVVACWTAGQLIERAILHQGYDSQQIHLINPGCPHSSIALQCRIVALNTFQYYNHGLN